jgi:hypothetical protein
LLPLNCLNVYEWRGIRKLTAHEGLRSWITSRGGLRNMQYIHEIAHAQFPVEQQVQNSQPSAVGKSAKHQINLRFRHGSVYSLARLYFAEISGERPPF